MQVLISDHRYQYDDDNIQDTFISHLNNYEETQKQVNHNHSSPVNSVKLSYSAAFFIHKVGGIVEKVTSTSKNRITGMSTTFSSRLQNFRVCVTNAIAMYENHGVFNDFNTELNVLTYMWDYAVYGINICNGDFDKLQNFQTAINAIATDFQLNYKDSSKKTQQCAVCGAFGHTFYECPALQDSDQIKRAYI